MVAFQTELASAATDIAGYVTAAGGAAVVAGLALLGMKRAWRAFKSIG